MQQQGGDAKDFNSYGSRRGNHEVMMRGTFANICIKNEVLGGEEGGNTLHIPSAEKLSIYDAAMRYQAEQTPLVIIAGKEYVTEFMQRYDENLQKAKAEYQTIFTEQFKAIANNKATISSKDVDAYAKLLFKHFDANKNGRLEANEL